MFTCVLLVPTDDSLLCYPPFTRGEEASRELAAVGSLLLLYLCCPLSCLGHVHTSFYIDNHLLTMCTYVIL